MATQLRHVAKPGVVPFTRGMNFKLFGTTILVVNIKFGLFFGSSTQQVSLLNRSKQKVTVSCHGHWVVMGCKMCPVFAWVTACFFYDRVLYGQFV